MKTTYPETYNHPAPIPGIPYFTPHHPIAPGTALPTQTPSSKTIPTLFTPLPLRSLTLKNRILVAPMCQYSAASSGPQTGAFTPYHTMSLGSYAHRGAALVFTEATAVSLNGRISPNCTSLHSDVQIAALRDVAMFVRSQGAVMGIQLAHAGRKASTVAPFVAARLGRRSVRAGREVGGWPGEVVAPSGGEVVGTWDLKEERDPEGGFYLPRGLSTEEVRAMAAEWARAANRAVRAGVQVVEIHAAHGYLLHEFLSPVTNRRGDEYGGGFEGRTRLLREIIVAIRGAIPAEVPLFLRVSATEWLEDTEVAKEVGGSWTLDETIRLAKIVADMGVDLLDVSSGGNHPQQKINMFASKDYQIKMAAQIRRGLRAAGKDMLVGAVGLITEAEQAANITEEAREASKMVEANGSGSPMADVVLVARQFMREPEWVLRVAATLGVAVAWPSQLDRLRFSKL